MSISNVISLTGWLDGASQQMFNLSYNKPTLAVRIYWLIKKRLPQFFI